MYRSDRAKATLLLSFCLLNFFQIGLVESLKFARSKREAFRFPEHDLNRRSSGSGIASLLRQQLRDHQAIISSPGRSNSNEQVLPSNQMMRLRHGRDPSVGYLELFSGKEWFFLCDQSRSWDIQEATVACRQMGYEDGAIHTTHGNSSLGDLQAVFLNDFRSINMELKCKGDERELRSCSWRTSQASCDMRIGAVSLVCSKLSYALCPGNTEPFGNSCYKLESQLQSFLGAQDKCEQQGGYLLELDEQAENDFVTEWLKTLPNAPSRLWTGGLKDSIAGKSFLVWHHSTNPVTFSTFSLSSDNLLAPEETLKGISLFYTRHYYFWNLRDMTEELPFVCEFDQVDVGCISESGSDYNGTASRGESGKTCVKWSTPNLPEIFSGQSSWEHNFCRYIIKRQMS